MAQSLVVSGLAAKRAELTGQIQHYRTQIAKLAGDVAHLDATIKLFDPEMDLRSVRPKGHRQRNSYFKPGEAPRAVLDALREDGKPLTSRQLTERIMTAKGVELTPRVIECVQKSLLVVLKGLVGKRLLRVVATEKSGVHAWEVA